ncbi:phage tail fiber protein [Pectobacterium carotovorum]|uniref:phage tail fiber protein n=1 Tax=Pectobacterium carotovorum TaxID=554 RepID=UPI0035BC1870
MSGRLEIADIVKVTGAGPALPDSQGTFLCWNRVNGQGRTDFVNHRGSGSGGFSFWNGNHEALSELASLNSSGSLYVSGTLHEAGQRVYSPNNKPTPEDIGTYSKNEGDARYLKLSGGEVTGELQLSSANALRLDYGDYGVIFRNDGNRFYLMLTNKGDKKGSFNTLQPFDINLSTGDLTAGHNVSVAGSITEKGQRVYSPNNKPTATDVGALTDALAAQKYALRSIRVNGKPLSADVNLLAGDINTWNKTEADARYLMKGVTVPGTITATGSGSGYYWRKYADGMVELFGTFETVINASRDVAFPVKLGEVVNITWNEVGGYNGANAFVGRVSGVSGSGFTHHWDVWDSNRYGSGNNQTIHYHVLAKAA